MDRPPGSWIRDPETEELTPDMNDQAMAARATDAAGQPASQSASQPTNSEEVNDNAV